MLSRCLTGGVLNTNDLAQALVGLAENDPLAATGLFAAIAERLGRGEGVAGALDGLEHGEDLGRCEAARMPAPPRPEESGDSLARDSPTPPR